MTNSWRAAILIIFTICAFPAASQEPARIFYIGMQDDPYYTPQPVYTGLSLKDRHPAVTGAKLAMQGTRILQRALGLRFVLDEILLEPGQLAVPAIRAARDAGALAIILDLPAEIMRTVVQSEGNAGTILFNVRHPEAVWREEACAPYLLHTIPSDVMLADAMAQHLRFQGWDRILLITGQSEAELRQAEEARRAASKFGLRVVEARAFELTNDPRERQFSNIRLLTGGAAYDVVWLIDGLGEFGRYVPYATQSPRPVVGSEGLVARTWHWTWERHGAPQLNQRFRKVADHDMTAEEWAAWAAVRSVIEAAQRTGAVEAAAVADFLRSDALSLDLYKGVPGNFRAWNGQLRQPILLTTHNAVISRAPLEGFEHRTDTLDTLGIDRSESLCRAYSDID